MSKDYAHHGRIRSNATRDIFFWEQRNLLTYLSPKIHVYRFKIWKPEAALTSNSEDRRHI